MNLVRFAFLTAVLASFPVVAADAGLAPASPVVDAAGGSKLAPLRTKAEQGDAQAQYDLGLAYFQGKETPQDFVEAFVWLTLATEGGVSGDALEPVLKGLQFSQLPQTRRRLESLRTDFPALREPASRPTVKAPVVEKRAALGIATASSRSAPAPVNVDSSPDPTRAVDPKQLQEQPKPAETQQRESQTSLSRQSTEPAARRTDSVASRIEPERGRTEPATAKEAPAAGTAKAPATAEAVAVLEREQTAHAATKVALADAKRQLADLATSRTALERELTARAVAAERGQVAAADEVKKQTARATEFSGKADAIARDLALARVDSESTRKALAAAPHQATVDNGQQARQIAALEAKLSDTTRELTKAKADLVVATVAATTAATTRSADDQTEAARQAEAKLSALRAEKTTLERDLQAALAAAAKNTTAKIANETALTAASQKLAEANREITTLRQRIDDGQRQLSASPDQKAAALQAELDEARSKLSAAEKAAADRSYEVAGLRVALNAASSRPKVSPADLDAARREAAQVRKQLASATEELTTLRSQAGAARDFEARGRQLEAEKKLP